MKSWGCSFFKFKRGLLVLFSFFFLVGLFAQEVEILEADGGALAAMLAISPKYLEQIYTVKGSKGNPDPYFWYITAKEYDDLGSLHALKVGRGEVVQDKLTFHLVNTFWGAAFITPPDIEVDSEEVFRIAQTYLEEMGYQLEYVDYFLSRKNRDSIPIWKLVCFAANGHKIGVLHLSAKTGEILGVKGVKPIKQL